MMDEGYIKYRCCWVKEDAIASNNLMADVVELTRYRNALYQLGLIGEYPNGVGFGNLSQKVSSPHFPPSSLSPSPLPPPCSPFIITGTQTGHLATLTAADYALVTEFDAAKNTVTCKGLRRASSESLTHGVIYDTQASISAVIHVHHSQLWQNLLNQVPTTAADVPYGTPEMAAETQRLFQDTPLLQQRIFVMAGHEDGVVAFGENLQMAYRVLINWSTMVGIVPENALQLPFR